MKNNKFPCTKCGACCKFASAHNNLIDFFKKAAERGIFEEDVVGDLNEALPTKDDGTCKHLLEDRTCAIYESRPKICRIMEATLKPKVFSQEEWLHANMFMCNELMVKIEPNIPEKYKIDIPAEIQKTAQKLSEKYHNIMNQFAARFKK